jgi:hypothetical protein
MTQEFTLECDGMEPSISIEYQDGNTDHVILMYRDDTWSLDDGEVLTGKFSAKVIAAIYHEIDRINQPVTQNSAASEDVRLNQANEALSALCNKLSVKLSITDGEFVLVDMRSNKEIVIDKKATL